MRARVRRGGDGKGDEDAATCTGSDASFADDGVDASSVGGGAATRDFCGRWRSGHVHELGRDEARAP